MKIAVAIMTVLLNPHINAVLKWRALNSTNISFNMIIKTATINTAPAGRSDIKKPPSIPNKMNIKYFSEFPFFMNKSTMINNNKVKGISDIISALKFNTHGLKINISTRKIEVSDEKYIL